MDLVGILFQVEQLNVDLAPREPVQLPLPPADHAGGFAIARDLLGKHVRRPVGIRLAGQCRPQGAPRAVRQRHGTTGFEDRGGEVDLDDARRHAPRGGDDCGHFGGSVIKDALRPQAVIANRYGNGRAVLAGTEVFRQYSLDPQAAMTALLRREIRASGVRPTAIVNGDVTNIEVSRLTGPGGLLVLITNHNPYEVAFNIDLPDSGPWIDLETNRLRDLSGMLHMAAESTIAVKEQPPCE